MKKVIVVPLESINGIPFGADRAVVRKKFGSAFKEFRKSFLSENTTDAYEYCHLFYSKDNRFEAIEIFEPGQVVVNGKNIFPGTVDDLCEVFHGLKEENGEFLDLTNSVGVTVAEDNNTVEGILFGCKDYYS